MKYKTSLVALNALATALALSACNQNPQPVPAPKVVASPAAVCGPVPYAVGWTDVNGQATAQLVQAAQSKLTTSPPSVRAGGDLARTAATGVVSQAMNAVLDNYECVAKSWLSAHHQPAATIDALTKGITRLKQTIFDYGNQIATDPKSFTASYASISSYVRKQGVDPVIPTDILSSALSMPNFLTQEQLTAKLSAAVGPLSLGACGGITKAAVQDGGRNMPVALAALRPAVINYFDPDSPSGPATAFTDLAGQMQAVSGASAAAADSTACSASLPSSPA